MVKERHYHVLRINYNSGKICGQDYWLESKNKLFENSELVKRKIEEATKTSCMSKKRIKGIKLEEITKQMYEFRLVGRGTGTF